MVLRISWVNKVYYLKIRLLFVFRGHFCQQIVKNLPLLEFKTNKSLKKNIIWIRFYLKKEYKMHQVCQMYNNKNWKYQNEV